MQPMNPTLIFCICNLLINLIIQSARIASIDTFVEQSSFIVRRVQAYSKKNLFSIEQLSYVEFFRRCQYDLKIGVLFSC